jgi:hypothetical protein
MNRVHQVSIASERVEGRHIRGLQQVAHLDLLGLQIPELLPSEVVFQVAPPPLDRVQLRTVGREEHEAHVGWEGEPLGRMGPTVVHEQEVQAVGKSPGEGIHPELEGAGIQRGPLQKEAFPCDRRHGPIDVERLKDVLDRAHRLAAAGREPPSPDRQQAKAAFVLPEHAHRAGILRRDDALPLRSAGRLKCTNGVQVFWCDWAGAL